jgi:hypothetical protein
MANKVGYPLPIWAFIFSPSSRRNFHVEFNMFYDPSNQKETATVRELINSSVNP